MLFEHSPGCVAGVGDCHVSGPQTIESSQNCQGIPQRVSTFHAYQTGYSAGPVRLQDTCNNTNIV